MGKNYRNRTFALIQTPPPSRPPEGLSKRKESTTSFSLSANTGWRIRDRSGECTSSSPNSEKQPDSCLLLKKRIREDCSKELPSSTECIGMVSSPTRNSSSITSLGLPSTNSSTSDSRLESTKKGSKQSPSTKQECWSTRDTSKSARAWWTLTNSWLEPALRRRSTWLPFLPSRQRSLAELAARKTKERKKKNDSVYPKYSNSCQW